MALTDAQRIQRYGRVVLLCASRSNPDKAPYEVREKNGVYSCNCPAWIFSRGEKRCKHTDEAQDKKESGPEYRALEMMSAVVPLISGHLAAHRELLAGALREWMAAVGATINSVPDTTDVEMFGGVRMIRFDD